MEVTVRKNFAVMCDHVTDAGMGLAAILAHLRDEIQRMPHGMQPRLGPRSLGLSGRGSGILQLPASSSANRRS